MAIGIARDTLLITLFPFGFGDIIFIYFVLQLNLTWVLIMLAVKRSKFWVSNLLLNFTPLFVVDSEINRPSNSMT
jgi:hypothetical protein